LWSSSVCVCERERERERASSWGFRRWVVRSLAVEGGQGEF